MAAGVIVFPLLFNVLLPAFGWRGTIFILGGIIANACPVSLMLRPLQQHRKNFSKEEITNNERVSSGQESSVAGICFQKTGLFLFRHNIKFVTICFITCLCGFGYNLALVYLPSLIRYRTLSNKLAYLMISLVGTGSFCGRACTGLVVKEGSKLFSARNWCVLTTIASGILLFTTTFTTSTFGFITFALLFGWASGLTWPIYSVLTRQYVGSEMFTHAFGYMVLFQGIGELIAPVFAGKYNKEQIIDKWRSWHFTFSFSDISNEFLRFSDLKDSSNISCSK